MTLPKHAEDYSGKMEFKSSADLTELNNTNSLHLNPGYPSIFRLTLSTRLLRLTALDITLEKRTDVVQTDKKNTLETPSDVKKAHTLQF